MCQSNRADCGICKVNEKEECDRCNFFTLSWILIDRNDCGAHQKWNRSQCRDKSNTGSSGLSKEEVEKLRKEAELHADEDKKIRELAEARNRLDAGVFTAEKFLADNGEKMPAEAKASAEAALKEAQEALKKTDASAEDFEKAATALQTALMAAAQTVPASAGEQPQADAGPAPDAPEGKKKAKDGKVVDGDFEVVDDGKK